MLTIGAAHIQGETATISGTASDAYAVRVVKWTMPGGATGTAQLTWNITSGSYEGGYVSQSDWTADVPLAAGSSQATVTAENIHGVTATTAVPLPGFGFTGVSVGSDGAVWAVGANPVNGGYGIYHRTGNGWQNVAGGAVAIGVGPTGSPWVVNSGHKIFQWAGTGWTLAAGAATDISVGSDGAVWVIGTNAVNGGYGIYRRTGNGWQRVPGGAVAIGVGPTGSPWVVNSGHKIFQWAGTGWTLAAGAATDISVGSDGAVWVIGTNAVNGGYGIYRRTGNGWQRVPGGAVAIGVGHSREPLGRQLGSSDLSVDRYGLDSGRGRLKWGDSARCEC